jgi:hypothetical protein
MLLKDMKEMRPADVRSVWEALYDIWRPRHQRWLDTSQALYDRDYDGNITVPRGHKNEKVIPPTARRIVHTTTNQVITQYPKVEVPYLNERDSTKRNARKAKMFDEALLRSWRVDNNMDLARMAFRFLILRGASVIKGPIWDTKLWPTRPMGPKGGESQDSFANRLAEWASRSRGVVPIHSYAVDPLEVLWNPDAERVPDIVIHKTRRYAYELQQKYGLGYDAVPNTVADARKPFTLMDCYEIWTDKLYAFCTERDWLIPPKRNPFGFQPWTVGYSMLGVPSNKADRSTSGGFVDYAVGVLEEMDSLIVADAQFLTALHIMFQATVFRSLFYTGDANALAQVIDPGPMGITGGVSKDEIHFPDMPEIPQWGFGLKQLYDSYIDEGGINQAMQGVSAPNVEAGYHQALNIGQGRLQIDPLRAQIEAMLSVTLENAHRLVKRVGDPLTLEAQDEFEGTELKIQPNDFNNLGRPRVTLEPEDKFAKRMVMDEVINLKDRNMIDNETALERIGGYDVEKITIRKLIQGAMESPGMAAEVLEMAAKEYGLNKLLAMLKAQEQGQQGQLAGGGNGRGRTPTPDIMRALGNPAGQPGSDRYSTGAAPPRGS